MKIDIENDKIDMTHGSGGRIMARLIEQMFFKAFDNKLLAQGNDQARIDLPLINGKSARLAISTDSFVISPLFFEGGDIGSLSVHGSVNDVALSGAKPLWLTVGFILEEGLPLKDLQKIVNSMAKSAKEAGVEIVTGDTKVVEKGKADGIFINTTCAGILDPRIDLSINKIKEGDAIIVSGTIGDHGTSIMAMRSNIRFEKEVISDSAPLNDLINDMIKSKSDIHAMRDPTRGGIGATLNEIAKEIGMGMVLNEEDLPIRKEVKAISEVLGLDPLYIANEGKLIAFCAKEDAEKLLSIMQKHKYGKDAKIIGKVIKDKNHFVSMKTKYGGERMIDWLAGDQLPRIC